MPSEIVGIAPAQPFARGSDPTPAWLTGWRRCNFAALLAGRTSVGNLLHGLHLEHGSFLRAGFLSLLSGISRPHSRRARDLDFVPHLVRQLVRLTVKPVKGSVALREYVAAVRKLQAALNCRGSGLAGGLTDGLHLQT